MHPRDLYLQRPDVFGFSAFAKTLRNALGDGNRARGGERAIVETGAGDDVGDRAGVGGREPDRGQAVVDRVEIVERDIGQNEVLLVADANLVARIVLSEVGDRVHLVGARVPRRAADRLQ